MKKQYLLVIAVAIILISGCNKKIVSPSDGDTIIPPTTKVISNSKWDESFISVDTTNYTFTFSENPNLQVGDIMVSSKDGGYLRRLTNIKQNGNNTVYETEFVSISEAIEDTKTTFETDLVVDNNKLKSAFLAKGVTIDKQSLKNSNNTNLNLNINIVLYDKDGNTNTTGDQIKLKGSYGTSTSLKTDIEIHNFNLKKLALTYTMTKQESLKATCGISSVVEKRIAKIPFGDFVIPAGIPITVSPVLEIYAGVTVNFNAGTEVSEEISETINCTTLVQYLNGEWSTDKTVDKVFNYNPPSFNSNVSLVGYIKPVLKFKIYRVLSPKVNSKLYAELDAYERAINWELYAGFQAGVGIDMKIWKKDIFDFNLNIIDVKDLLANGTIGNDAPVADFTATPTSGTAPLTVTFTDQSTNTPTSWQWDFGDGSTSTQQNPAYKYNNAGTYNVSLTATNNVGSDTKTQNNYITVASGGTAPVADFTATPTSGTAPLTVNFTDQSTNTPTSWQWDFGDGGTSTQQNPSHTYNNAGTYNITLSVSNNYGNDTKTQNDYILISNNAGELWSDNFDNYELNLFPPNWTASGNGDQSYVTNENFYSAPNSLSMEGISGGNWEGVIHREYDNTYAHYKFEFMYLYTGEGQVGMHVGHGAFSIRSEASWNSTYSRGFVKFDNDNNIICFPSLTVIGSYTVNNWVKIRVDYQRLENSVLLKYYVNDQLMYQENADKVPGEDQLKYFTLESFDTRCLYDNIVVSN